jgi:multiple sugar transport system permease protein
MARFETSTRTLISPARLNRPGGRRVYWIVVLLTIVAFSFVFLGPLYWMVSGALKSGNEIAQIPPTLYPKHPEFSNYVTAWKSLTLGHLLLNTLYYTFGALVFQLVFQISAAYAFSKLRPIGSNILLGMVLATLMVPATVLIVPQFVTVLNIPFFHWNLIDTPWAIWLPAVTSAFNIFLLKRFFDSIPEDLLAAAAIDGAGSLRTLWSIVLPISRPVIGVVAIFSITATWKDFLWPLLVESAPSKMTINVGINAFSAGLPQNVILGAAVIAAVPTIVFFLIFQRNIMSGLTTGGIKG